MKIKKLKKEELIEFLVDNGIAIETKRSKDFLKGCYQVGLYRFWLPPDYTPTAIPKSDSDENEPNTCVTQGIKQGTDTIVKVNNEELLSLLFNQLGSIVEFSKKEPSSGYVEIKEGSEYDLKDASFKINRDCENSFDLCFISNDAIDLQINTRDCDILILKNNGFIICVVYDEILKSFFDNNCIIYLSKNSLEVAIGDCYSALKVIGMEPYNHNYNSFTVPLNWKPSIPYEVFGIGVVGIV